MFKAAYLNELYKISKKKKVIIASVLTIIAVAIAIVTVNLINNFMGINVTGNSEFSILVLRVLSLTLIPLFTTFICIDMFGGEFSDVTIKITLTRPVSRFKIFSAKAMAAATFIMANLICIMVLSVITSFFGTGSAISIGKIILAYLAAFLPLFVFALVVIFISNIVKGTTSAFFLSVLIFIAFNTIGIIFSDMQSFLFTSMFDWYTLFLGSYINFQKIFRVLLILFGCGTMFYVAGYYLFDKKDI